MKTTPALVMLVIAGPNGAGKSSLKELVLQGLGLSFVNPDEIQHRLGDCTDPYAAAKIADSIRKDLVGQRRSFAFETVLSDPKGEKVRFLEDAVQRGYTVFLHYVGIRSPELSRARVFQRVSQGGHDVPSEKIKPRYHRSLTNLNRLLDSVHEAVIYDNSSSAEPFQVLAILKSGRVTHLAESLPPWTDVLRLKDRPQG